MHPGRACCSSPVATVPSACTIYHIRSVWSPAGHVTSRNNDVTDSKENARLFLPLFGGPQQAATGCSVIAARELPILPAQPQRSCPLRVERARDEPYPCRWRRAVPLWASRGMRARFTALLHFRAVWHISEIASRELPILPAQPQRSCPLRVLNLELRTLRISSSITQ